MRLCFGDENDSRSGRGCAADRESSRGTLEPISGKSDLDRAATRTASGWNIGGRTA